MRSLIIIVTTVFTLVGVFFIYQFVQRPKGPHQTSVQTGPKSAPTQPAQISGGGVGPTQNGRMDYYDKKTGAKTSEIYVGRSQPLPDGRVQVEDAQAIFFLNNGQILSIFGKNGKVVMQRSMPHGGDTSNFDQSPARGELHDVTIQLFKTAGAAEPSLTLTTDNASFDNENLRVFTRSYTDSTGQDIKADEVPVTVRGDYDFDGKGLEIRWNDLDHHLEYLEVFHGQRLVIYHPGAYMKEQAGPTALEPLPDVLAAKDKGSAGEAIQHDHDTRLRSPATHPTTQADEVVYRALFNDNVRVTQGEELLATANKMQVDFRRGSGGKDGPSTRPAKTSGGSSTKPSTQPLANRPAATRPAQAAATTAPATQPDDLPIVVTWTGPLTVVPLETSAGSEVAPGQSILELMGSDKVAAMAQHQGSQIHAAALTYRTEDRMARAVDGPTGPVVMTDTGGAVVKTPFVEFHPLQNIATLNGKSNARVPTKSGAPAGADELYAEWTDQCTLYFQTVDGKESISRAELHGDVKVRHPELTLDSRSLSLDFDPASPKSKPTTKPAVNPTTIPTTKPANHDIQAMLRRLDATDDVHCELIDSAKDKHTIDCQHLQMRTERTADFKVYPHEVVADGAVHAVDPKEDLHSGHLNITLKPSTRPTTRSARATSGPTTGPASTQPAPDQMAVELQTLLAQDNVNVVMADGSTAKADELTVEATPGGKQAISLRGKPAVATQHQSDISGPNIQFDPDTQAVHVVGAGELHSFQQDTPTSPSRPMHVTWQTGLTSEGNSNRVDVVGSAVATSLQQDGSFDTAKGDRIILALADAPPTTRPTTRESTTLPATLPTTRHASTKPSSDQAGVFGKKIIKSVVLMDQASVNSTTRDPAGKILTATQLDAPVINYDVINKHLQVDVPGSLTMEDHRPATTQPAGDNAMGGDMRGQTAMVWKQHLSFDETGQQAVVEGDVRIGHQNEGPDGKSFQMFGDKFVADLIPTTRPTTRPTNGAAPTQLQLKHIHGEGNIVFHTDGLWFESDTIDYDPMTHELIALGTVRHPGRQLIDKPGPDQDLERARFEELHYNSVTGACSFPKGFNATLLRTAANHQTGPSMKFDHVAIPSNDIAASIGWYTTRFGAKVLYQDSTWAFLEVGGSKLALVSPTQHPPHVAIQVTKEELAKAAHEASIPIETHRDGTTGIYLHDPFGNAVELICYP